MCRWMAWSGQPVIVEELLFKPPHGLIDQSLHSRMGVETTNGDGFGLGWYGAGEGPGMYKSVAPAWGDANLRELAAHIESPLFIAHVRATTGTAIQETNCHPFRHGRWLMVHNGVIAGFHEMRRELMLEVAPELFADIQGSTDSEVLFHLALTYGLERDPVACAGARDRARRGDGGAAWHRERRADEHRRHRRRAAVGVPLLDGAEVALAVRVVRRGGGARAASREPAPPAAASTRTASWCPSRSPTCRACGRRSPSRPSWSSSRARTSSAIPPALRARAARAVVTTPELPPAEPAGAGPRSRSSSRSPRSSRRWGSSSR